MASPLVYIHKANEQREHEELADLKRDVIAVLPKLCPKCRKRLEEILKVHDKPE